MLKRMRGHPAIFLVACIAASVAWIVVRASGETARHADEYLRTVVKREHFSGAVLIAHERRVLFERGYGFANAAWHIENTPQTRFSIASITKTFTAALLLKLYEQGKVSLEDSIRSYVDPCETRWNAITLHHVLSHTSGIANFTDGDEFQRRKRLQTTPAQVLEIVRKEPLRFEPGSRFEYSNTNYLLLGLVIEAVTHKPYGVALREQFLDQLGMSDTGVDRSDVMIERHASGYRFSPDAFVPAEFVDPSWALASGNLYSTIGDLQLWGRAFDEAQHLTPDTIRRMTSAVSEDYGYGWSVSNTNGRRAVSHSGRIDGFLSCIARFPDERMTVVVLANREIKTHACTIASNLAAIGRGDYASVKIERHAIRLNRSLLRSYTGSFRFSAELTAIIEAEEGKLFARIAGQDVRLEMLAESETHFFLKEFATDIEFELEDGRVTRIHVYRPLQDKLIGVRVEE